MNYSIETKRLRATLGGRYRFNAINNAFAWANVGSKVEQFNAQNPISEGHNTWSSLFFESNFMKIYDKQFARALCARHMEAILPEPTSVLKSAYFKITFF